MNAPTSIEAPFALRMGYCDGPYGQVHYRDTGKGAPLVLFHQAPMSSQEFTAVYPLLHNHGIRAIGVDMPGFGASAVTPFTPTVEDWAGIYPAVLDHLGIDRADVAGHNTGAAVAAEAALRFPDRVRKVINHGALMVTEEERAIRLKKVEEGEKGGPDHLEDGRHLSEAFVRTWKRFAAGGAPDPKRITAFVTEAFTNTGPNWYGHHAAYAYDHAAALRRIAAPLMIMTNTGDMLYALTQRAKAVRPDVPFVELEGGAIDVIDQLPAQWASEVARFLKA